MENEKPIGNDLNKLKIDKITAQFFDLFTNADNKIPNVHGIKAFFIPNGILINNTEEQSVIYDIESFIKPREEILTNGILQDFREWELTSETVIHRNIAHRVCQYKKQGTLNGNRFEGKGHKMIQFIKVNEKWTMSSVIWSDE